MATRIHELAKQLGVKSKAIIEKCVAEGVPADKVKNHMTVLSPGLEASIREWFSGSEEASSTTAVETAAHVDIEQVRAKPRARAKARRKAADTEAPTPDLSSDSGTATGVVDAPPPTQAPVSPAAPDDQPDPATKPAARKVTPSVRQPAAGAPAPDAPEPEQPVAPTEPVAPAAKGPETETPNDRPGDDAAPPKPEPPKPTFNEPTRPKVVAPVGRQLKKKTPVKLSGPKIVRIEQPDQLERSRPRRPMVDSGPRGGGGAGAGVYPPSAPDDRGGGRGAGRRNKRRGGGDDRAGAPSRRNRQDDGLGTGVFSEQDLMERQDRLQRAGGYLKQKRQQLRRQDRAGGQDRPATAAQVGGEVKIAAPFTIKDLSAATGVKGAEIVKKLFMQGVMASINSGIEPEKAQEIMLDYNIELVVEEAKSAEDVVAEQFAERDATDERSRSPIVTIMGHVDHGKTSLLDRIRNANVAAGEAGGITQATSAFRVPVSVGDTEKHVVFIDTPGHEAFTQMRARGATITDICVLVVAADDGVMPQTAESISHAKAAGVPIVVALNKIDKPEATDDNIQRIYGQLAEKDINPSAWGGDIEVIKTSAHTGEGIEELLEVLDLQGQVLELKADFDGPARGAVIESRFEPGRGPTATIIVEDGKLSVGDFIVVGRGFGRVRDIIDDRGERLDSVGPARPVQISGFDELPDAGDKFYIAGTLKQAQDAAEQRRRREREAQLAQPKVTLDSMFSKMAEQDMKEILLVVKADVQGSLDVLRSECEKVSTDEVRVRVLHAAVGGITESDVILAQASGAVIVGFNVIPTGKARSTAEEKSVEIRTYQVIYEITDDIRKAAEGLLEPELREEVLGHAEVRQVFKVSKVGAIAGCYVTDGVVQRDAFIRVTRDEVIIENNRVLEQLKRFKEDAKEVRNGNECGMKIAGYDDIKEGDVLECYRTVAVKRTL